MPHKLIHQTNVTINVRDLDVSVDFYLKLGFELKQRWGKYYAQMTAPGIEIGLHPTEASRIAGHSGNVSLGFTSLDFEKAEESLKAQNVAYTIRKEQGGSFLHFTDPDGTALYFIKPK